MLPDIKIYDPLDVRCDRLYKVKRGNKYNRRCGRLLLIDPYCYYCRRELNILDATIDHYIPRSKGGTNDSSNLVLACEKCNNEKADQLPDKFIGTRISK